MWFGGNNLKGRIHLSNTPIHLFRTRLPEKTLRKQCFFLMMCSACAERDVSFGRDACFASDVRFAREKRNTSLCAAGANITISREFDFICQKREFIFPSPSDIADKSVRQRQKVISVVIKAAPAMKKPPHFKLILRMRFAIL